MKKMQNSCKEIVFPFVFFILNIVTILQTPTWYDLPQNVICLCKQILKESTCSELIILQCIDVEA